METIVYIFIDHGFVPAGRLLFEQSGRQSRSIFAYGRKYIDKKDALPIDPIALPLSEQEYHTPIDFPIFNVIADAGPDAWGRYLCTKRFNRELNELEFVLAAAGDRVGALAFGPTSIEGPRRLATEGFEEYSSPDFDLDFCLNATDDAIANESSDTLEHYLQYGSSLGGARPKAATIWQKVPYLAKFSVSLDRRNEPLIEFATMKLAKLCGLDVPNIARTRALNRDVYLIERFDRLVKGKEFKPVPFISGLTAIQAHESDYEAWSYRRLCDAISKISDTPTRDKEELYRRMVFNILVNNDDDHPRNHGFIHKKNNKWRLSKLYDVVPRDQLTTTYRLALNVGDYGKEASKRNAVSASQYFGLEEKAAEHVWDELEHIVCSKWQKTFAEAGLNREEIARFKTSISPK